MTKEIIIGIDLGTVNSCVAWYNNGKPEIIANEEGMRTTPSVVAYTKDQILVGEAAKRQQITNTDKTIHSAKRFMGMKRKDVIADAKRMAYGVVTGQEDKAVFDIGGQIITPEQAGAQILIKLKKAAETYLGKEIKKCCITVPAYFNNEQRQATKDACQVAGMECVRLINEPTSACIAYGLDKKNDRKVLVQDFGGGTMDNSILEINNSVIEVISTHGDTALGGNDIDDRLTDYIITEFKNESGIDLSKDKIAVQRIRTDAERAKKELSSILEVEINLPFITADANGPKHLSTKITRAKFESLISDLIDRVFASVDQVIKDSKLNISEIDEVIFVGGSTRIPMVYERTKKMFGKEPNRSVNPDEIVALGAAVQAGILSGEHNDLLLLDVTSLSLGLETLGGVMTNLINRNTTIPTKKSQVFSTAADNQTSVTINIAQGERKMFADNQLLATFNLDEIPPARRGQPQISVSFDIDANGIVNVSAKDLATGKDKSITIKSGLSSEEVERMIKDAEANSAADEKRAQEVISLNELDTLVFSTERMLKDQEEQLKGYDTADVKIAMEEAASVVKDRKLDAIQAVKEKLTNAVHKMSEYMYSRSAPPEQTQPAAEQTSTDDVIDVSPGI